MTLPLSHIRVVEICQHLAGPMTAMHLADQGADVIKIEPHAGDSTRGDSPAIHDTPGMGLRILTFNRNKRAIVVDYAKPHGLEIVHALVRRADVFVINVRVGARQRHGLTYEDLAAKNPRLVYASITGFGDEGPEADLPGNDMTIQARSGDLAARRLPNSSPPGQTSLWHIDMSTAMLAFGAIVLALYERDRTGKGQKVEANLLQSAMALQALQLTRASGIAGGYPAKSDGLPSHYPCSDGRYIYMGAGGDRWGTVCGALGLEALVEDPRFSTQEKRVHNDGVLREILARYFATRPAAEWEAMLKSQRQYASVLNDIGDLYDDPQVIANEMIVQFEQPGMGWVKAVNAPFRMSEHLEEQRVWRSVPTLGQHTKEVLQELGYSPARIEFLKAEGVLA